MNNDNDTHNEVIQQSLVAWPYRRQRRGHDPREKKSVKAGVACAVGKVCTCTLLMTVCSSSDHKEKHVEGKKHKLLLVQILWIKVAGILGFCATQRRGHGDPGRQPDSRRKCVAGTVVHQSVQIAFRLSVSLDWWCEFSASVLVETSLTQSRLFFGVVFPRIISFLLVNSAAAAFHKLRLGAVCGANCGTATAYPKRFIFHISL